MSTEAAGWKGAGRQASAGTSNGEQEAWAARRVEREEAMAGTLRPCGQHHWVSSIKNQQPWAVWSPRMLDV